MEEGVINTPSIKLQGILAGDSSLIENLLPNEELEIMINYMKELRLNGGFEELKLKDGIAPRLIRQEYDNTDLFVIYRKFYSKTIY